MTTYIRTTEAEAVELDESWVILHPELFTVTKVNEVGGICWSLLRKPQTVQSMAAYLAERYSINVAEAAEDVESFLQQMKALGMIRHVE